MDEETKVVYDIRHTALREMNAARVQVERCERAFEIADKRYQRKILWNKIDALDKERDRLVAECDALRMDS